MTDKSLDIKTIVKKWIALDNELGEYKLKIRDLKNKKKEITTQLAEVMDYNNIDGFNINNDSKLVYKKKTVKGSLSKKLLVSTLSKYFDEDELSDVISFIMSQRIEKVTNDIHLK
jgi:hypothetical protein